MNIQNKNHQDNFSRIQTQPLQQQDYDALEYYPQCGGVTVFLGTVRNHHQGKAVLALKYTAYTPLAEKMIRQIEQDIEAKFQVERVRVIHRIGDLTVGETAIIAMAYAAHRHEAFLACEEAVERVKHEVPIYKEEFYLDGTSAFVEGCCIRYDREVVHVHHHHSHDKRCSS
ncbi:MAG: molybdenum cofactor biosynthesis protein MoaE [Acinetobacter sp.]|jgi:molybdopterin synthase catalytic subunit|nr:MAG: molybdenum cofactor biosynthesis protein MoaE [Acinetobacter sp.]